MEWEEMGGVVRQWEEKGREKEAIRDGLRLKGMEGNGRGLRVMERLKAMGNDGKETEGDGKTMRSDWRRWGDGASPLCPTRTRL